MARNVTSDPAPSPWRAIDPDVRFKVVDDRNLRPKSILHVDHHPSWYMHWTSPQNIGANKALGYEIMRASDHAKSPDHLGKHDFFIPSGAWREDEYGWVRNFEGFVLMAVPRWRVEDRRKRNPTPGLDAVKRHAEQNLGPAVPSPDVERNNALESFDPQEQRAAERARRAPRDD